MAHKKAAGSVKNGRDSVSKRLGVKVFGSETVRSGQVLVRQRGTKFHAGEGVKRTADDTLIATVDGVLAFIKKKVVAFNGNLKRRTYLTIETEEAPKKKPAKKATKKAAPKAEKKSDKVEAKTATTKKKAAPKKTATKKVTAKKTTKKTTK